MLFSKDLLFTLCLTVTIISCGGHLSKTSVPGERDEGLAVYYSDSLEGNKTANGEIYNKSKMTAAHRYLPFGSIVKVTNLSNMLSVRVRINDRGPFGDARRIIDLSRKAATQLDMISAGVVKVRLEFIERVKN